MQWQIILIHNLSALLIKLLKEIKRTVVVGLEEIVENCTNPLWRLDSNGYRLVERIVGHVERWRSFHILINWGKCCAF